MTENSFRKAVRSEAKLRLGVCGPAGSGKTYSALLIAAGLGGRIAVIDTERGSADLYADICEYDVAQLTPPYTPEKYMNLLHEAEKAGYTIIIMDSITHAWAGEGGLLDAHAEIVNRGGNKNSYTAWRTVTPRHTAFIDAMLNSSAHIIATMRSKTDYIQDVEADGKKIIRKVGMAPIQREGMDYEFTVVLDMAANHSAIATKDRTNLFPPERIFKPSPETGVELRDWLKGMTADQVQGDAPPAVSEESFPPKPAPTQAAEKPAESIQPTQTSPAGPKVVNELPGVTGATLPNSSSDAMSLEDLQRLKAEKEQRVQEARARKAAGSA